MNLDALLRAAQILRSQPGHTMPLAKLHARLSAELGTQVGSYGQIYHQLKNRPQSFALIDAPRLLEASVEWPRQVREEYDAALAGAGLGCCVRVALTEVPGEAYPPDALTLAGGTMSELWSIAESDPVLRELLIGAADQLDELTDLLSSASEAERPTTPPRDPLQ